MRAEEFLNENRVIPFDRRRPVPLTEGDRHEERDAAEHPEAAPTTVLNAERGIINTGTVHGGQHVTTIEFSGRARSGADGDV
ncbi:S-type pyocin domain-containing protein [Streptomyces sp. NPDC058848]|uniref:S-type pyocin domain-containing protein n=1 Tax=unclassified Streptomyces TaxID=2593676 RepID=UPI00367C329A